jgi:hypothetical protein
VTNPDQLARQRYFTMRAVELAGVAGAVFGLVIAGRSEAMALRLLGAAIILSALLMIAIVPRAMARRWRTPPNP